jgi:hypothetical protein
MGAYDLTQDSGQSCAARGTTTPVQLEQSFSNYLQAHPELMHADRTAAGVAAQAFAGYWPCQGQQGQSSPTFGPDAQIAPPTSALLKPVNIKLEVRDSFAVQNGYETNSRANVVMPSEYYNDNEGHWSLTCERLLGHGTYEGTYDQRKNKIRVQGLDLKGKPQTTKCEVFLHEWRAPAR